MKLKIQLLLLLLITACSQINNPIDNTATATTEITSDPETVTTPPPITSPPTTTPAPGSVSDRVFPADNIWNKDISNEPVDPQSSIFINALGATGVIHPSFGTVWNGAPNGIPYIVVPGNQSKVPVSFFYWRESEPGPYPIPTNPPIEGGDDGTGDRHVIVVDHENKKLYELYDAHPDGNGGWRAGSGAVFDLNSNDLRPAGWTSADAAGLPIFPGLVRYDEVMEKKVITHALRFTGKNIRAAYVSPARHSDGNSNDPAFPPMGIRVRLKANYDISGFLASAQVILKALKKYGMFLADTGARSWMISGAPNPKWIDRDLITLERVPGSAFEVVKMGVVTDY